MPSELSAVLSDIQHCCVHDGPGIRTTVFLKGCNMRCAWCHNPETVHPLPETLLSPEKCIGCGRCDQGCYSGARVLCGRRMTLDEVLREIDLDRAYYPPDGGVTVSGGEPLLQPEFTTALLRACRDRGIGTAVETNLNVPWQVLKTAALLCDVVMCDLKLMDDRLHREYTLTGNGRILENLRELAALGVPLIVRTPVVRGVNDSEENISAASELLAGLGGILYYELLTYHPLGLSKGKSEHFEPRRFEKPSRERMRRLADIAAAKGLPVRVDSIALKNLPEHRAGETEA